MKYGLLSIFMLLLVLTSVVSAQDGITLTVIGEYETGVFDEGAAEIGAYDAGTQRLFITNADANRIDVLDISDPTNPMLVADIVLDEFGDSINSVAAKNGIIAAAVEGEEVDTPGMIVFLNTDGEVLSSVTAGVLPDMVTISPDGNWAVSANEGEPSDEYDVDPEGSITIVDLSGGMENVTDENVTTLTFAEFGMDMLDDSVRVFGPNATVAQDLEPEYVAISPDSSTAFVTLQENNAVAVVDIAMGSITNVIGLGFKDYSLEENAIDPSNEDGAINIRPVPAFGMYQPDAIAAVEIDGTLYFLTANEGDARDYDTFSEEVRVGDEEIVLDEEAFPNAAELKEEANLGRLLITTTLGDTDNDGDYDELYSYGARSFTIFTADGEIVFDSGSDFETITAELVPDAFNSNGTADGFDGRSDDKGPEPEGITVGTIEDTFYAFIILERVGGVMVYDITDPENASFVTYANNADITGNAEEGTAGDIGPEGVIFISAEESPNGNPLLVVTNEVSGSTTIYEIG